MAHRPEVLLTIPAPDQVLDKIESTCSVRQVTGPMSRSKLFDLLQTAEGLYTAGLDIDDELLSHAPLLKVVSTVSVGYNRFDLEAMKRHGVLGTHTPYVLDDTVADLIMGLIISVARRIPELDRYVRNGLWQKDDGQYLFGTDVHHQTLGIIGLGRIGQTVAKRARYGFDMDVIYHNRRRNTAAEQSFGVRYEPLDELLRKSDFVLLMLPLTEQTIHYMAEEHFRCMKPGAFFINASRGKTVDEQALIKALQEKWIAGAGLDVFDKEPLPVPHPFQTLEQVVMVPHIGSATEETRTRMAEVAADNLIKAVLGQSPPYVIPELQSLLQH